MFLKSLENYYIIIYFHCQFSRLEIMYIKETLIASYPAYNPALNPLSVSVGAGGFGISSFSHSTTCGDERTPPPTIPRVLLHTSKSRDVKGSSRTPKPSRICSADGEKDPWLLIGQGGMNKRYNWLPLIRSEHFIAHAMRRKPGFTEIYKKWRYTINFLNILNKSL